MRIRKSGKFSPLLFSSANDQVHLHPHHCLLNRSPWDAIPFSESNWNSNSDFLQRDTRMDGNVNSMVVSPVVREELAVDKEVDGGDCTEIKTENDSELNGDGERGVSRRRSQRTAAKKARSLTSKRKDFYYYSEFGPLRK